MEVMDLNAYRYKTVLNSNWSHMLLFEKFPDYMHVYLLVIINIVKLVFLQIIDNGKSHLIFVSVAPKNYLNPESRDFINS